MSRVVADLDDTQAAGQAVPYTVSQIRALSRSDRKSKHRASRAGRVFSGNTNWLDKFSQLPDKGWAALILLGAVMVSISLGFAVCLLLGL